MCGRYASFRSAQDLADTFDVEQISDAAARVAAGYNIAPTDPVRVVLERRDGGESSSRGAASSARDGAESSSRDGAEPATRNGTEPATRAMHVARWGLIPHWAKDPTMGARMINARSESVAEKPAFSKSLAQRRCLVVADGYYEWHTAPDPAGGKKPVKTPYYIHPTDGAPIAFAGLYSWWPDPAKAPDDPDRWVLSTTIITQAARGGLEHIHDREPAVLDHDLVGAWIDRDAGTETALDILSRPCPPLTWHEVDRAVGSVRSQGAHLIEPV
ncbi:SOS response-associated peptidase [Pseudactinotalea sp. Z1748]|uniref:SOS response-associated peptidase n=1 Tax=Pseudactinotalea sp. Z1748 TaxID=3413027 RepID=UPI003C7D367A